MHKHAPRTKQRTPLQLYAKNGGLDSAQGALSALFWSACVVVCMREKERGEGKKSEHRATDDDDDDVDNRPAQANVSWKE